MASSVSILRPKFHWRLFGIVLVVGGAFVAYASLAAGEATVKMVLLCVALAVGGLPILYLLWVGGYVLDDRGIQRKLVPGLPSPSTPYRLLWREPIRASVTDHGFVLGKTLDLRNVGSDERVMLADTYAGFDRLLESIREHATSFDERSLGAAEGYLSGAAAEAAQPCVAGRHRA